MTFDLERYLGRVSLTRVTRTPEGLSALVAGQLRGLAFENVDPLLGRVPDLDPGAIYDKIILGGRGGYCFELNALLGGAMAALGFPVQRVLARVRNGAQRGGARTHLAILTEAGGIPFLADAGFGGPGPLAPLRLDTGAEQGAPNGRYRIADDRDTGETVVWRRGRDGWSGLYGFDRSFVGDTDVAAANWVTATWPNSPFPHYLMMNGYSGDTRIGIFNRAVTRQSVDREDRFDLTEFDDFREIVVGDIGLDLETGSLRRVWDRIADATPAAP